MDFLIILLLGFALMWLLIVLPQRRRQQAHRRLLAGLAVGDEIVTAGGLYGRVTRLAGDEVGLEVADGVEVSVARGAVAGLRERPEAAAERPADEAPG